MRMNVNCNLEFFCLGDRSNTNMNLILLGNRVCVFSGAIWLQVIWKIMGIGPLLKVSGLLLLLGREGTDEPFIDLD